MKLKEMRQQCPKCKGRGINDKQPKKDEGGRTILAPTYIAGEGNRPQYENCSECGGSGMTMQPPPRIRYEDGVKVELTEDQYNQIYQV